jgi:TetR/AcrR family transcriptional regulator, regulator of cefoperazone and chloramphenicol sensitivity
MTLAVKSDETRRKILNAAGRIFAQVGYETATVRQITESAGVNVSAINYHFGDKEALYREVLTDGLVEMHQRLLKRCSSGTPEERLRGYIEVMIRASVHEERPWQHVVMTREIFEQNRTDLMPDLFVELIRPTHLLLISIIRDLVGSEVSAEKIEIASQTVIGILIHWIHGKDIARRLCSELTFEEQQMERVTEQAYQFVLAGIGSIRT